MTTLALPNATQQQLDPGFVEEVLDACDDCARACLVCATSCITNPDVQRLVRCIRLTLDCADLATTTSRLLARAVADDLTLVRATLGLCVLACTSCADECALHALHGLDHCRRCAAACRRCADLCGQLLEAL